MENLKEVCEELISQGVNEIEVTIIQNIETIATFKINNLEEHNLKYYESFNYENIWYEIDETKEATVKAYLED